MVKILHPKKISSLLTLINKSANITNIAKATHIHTKENKMTNDFQKQMEQFAEMFKSAMTSVPHIKPNKNGYELRTKVLEFAQNQEWQDYHAKWGQYETHIHKEGDELVTKVTIPSAPGAEQVLATAKKFYEFVNGDKTKTEPK